MESYLLAIVIPDPVQLAKIASRVWKRPVSETDLVTLGEAAKDEKVVKATLNVLTKYGFKYGLKWFEFVKRIFVTNELFSVEWVFYPNDEDSQLCPNPLRSLVRLPVLLMRTWLGKTLIRGISKNWIPCMRSGSPSSRGRLSCRRGYGTPGRTRWACNHPDAGVLPSLSPISLNSDFRRGSPGPQVSGPVVVSSTSMFSIIMHVYIMVRGQALGQRHNGVVVPQACCFQSAQASYEFCTSIQQGRLNVPMPEDICDEQTVLGGRRMFNV